MSFNAAQTLQEEETDDDDRSIKASASSSKLKPQPPIASKSAKSVINEHDAHPPPWMDGTGWTRINVETTKWQVSPVLPCNHQVR